MKIDHFFIFSSNKGQIANELVEFGITEGSNRIHRGQGTANRKFYFDNFFLEVLWVDNESDIRSEQTSKTKLWERSQFEKSGHSPFGLCLVNSKSTDLLFQDSLVYQPNYFPQGMSIDIITNEKTPQLPWTFRLPYRDIQKKPNEPTKHANGIKKLTKVIFEYPSTKTQTVFEKYFEQIDSIVFKSEKQTHLTLEFDHCVQGKSKEFKQLQLSIKF